METVSRLTPDKLAELRRLYDAATKGPMYHDHITMDEDGPLHKPEPTCEVLSGSDEYASTRSGGMFSSPEDADLYAAMHNALPALLGRVEKLEWIVRAAIEWDGYDEEGVPAVWLDDAQAALGETK